MVAVFPALSGQSFHVEKTPNWNTTVKVAATGRQIRTTLQAYPVWSFKLAYEYIYDNAPSTSQLQELWSFFNSVAGQLGQFYFLDPFDNAVTAQQIGVGDGSTTSFQLTRTVGAAFSTPWVEPVYGVYGSPTVYVNGTPTSVTVGAYGVITFASAPAAGAVISWTGQFYFLCHFTVDKMTTAQMVKNLWSLDDGITFETLLA